MIIAHLLPEAENGRRYISRIEATTNDDQSKRDDPDLVYVLETMMPKDQVALLWKQCNRFYLVSKELGKIEEDYDIALTKK